MQGVFRRMIDMPKRYQNVMIVLLENTRRKGAQNEAGTFVSDGCVIDQQKQVQAAELAELFEVSVRTIYRDIETINRAGIPIVTSQGSGAELASWKRIGLKESG